MTLKRWNALPVMLPLMLMALQALGPGVAEGGETPADARVRAAQLLLRRQPLDARAHHRLGDAYVQKARETGDAKYFTLAEEALRKALAIAPGSSGAARHLAYVLYSRHAFAEAAAEARKAIALDPADSHALGILGDAQLEVGQYAEAEGTYQRMVALDEDLHALSRRSGLRSLEGDVDGAIADLERAVGEGKAAGRPAESVAWVQWQLATEHWSVGRLEAAEAGYQAALATYPGYHRALAGLAHVRAAQGRADEAVLLYRRAIDVVPQPDYVAALGDLLAKIGRHDEARRQYELVEYIGRLSSLNQALYNRELASFYLDHDTKLDAALVLARRELDVRRDVYAHDLLAWALLKNGQPEAAREAMVEALRLGTRDARLFYHAGMIERALGNVGAAARYLRLALDTNPYFNPLGADEARRALQALEGAGASSPWSGGPDAS
ncbi:MAG TPA: tetratricopeptide repeat protein [Methylomirabilota bacterium]|nr:tetratricopeptide repeat protein [Methylomirabilota bacterium]